ncbi:MAG: PAS domain-containing sensor histidine kinase [Methanoregula sp.]|jgi:PAS domain S-box-containing protein
MPADKTRAPKDKKDTVLTALRASEKKYRTIFENASIPTIIIEKDAKISLANNKFLQLIGFSQKDIEGKKKWTEFIAPEMVDKLTKFLADCRAMTEQAPRQYFVSLVDRKKQNRYVSLNAAVIPRTQRLILSFFEVPHDPQRENEFEYENLQMSGVIYYIPEPTFAIDRNGRIVAWNRAIEELTGILAADILRKGSNEYAIPFFRERRPMIIDLIFASDPDIEKRGYREIQWTGNTLSAETTVITPDGKSKIIREIASPVFSRSGELAGAIESITDVTTPRQQETDLKISESRCRTILENTGSAIAIIEENATISYINPEFEKIIGYVRDEVEGKKKWTEFVAPKELERMQKYEYECRINPKIATANNEFQFIRFDGQLRYGSLTMTPIPDTGMLILSLVDTSDKVQEEDALQRANKKLNVFSCITRHEILNHLTVVKGYIELSREQVRDPAFLLRSFDKELAAANAIQNLITFTRDYQNIGIQPPAWYNLTGLIKTAAASVRTGSITLSVDTDRVEIYADHLLERVFFHLIDNAVRYGRQIKNIRFFCEESFEELLVICEDDGIGIPPDAKEKTFNRQFFQNTGLDMYLSRQILSITDITIQETGIYGTGARFEIRVPKGAYRFISSS